MNKIVVVDYGSGNLYSVAKALEHVAPRGVSITISSDAKVIDTAARIVLPGQGAMPDCMNNLRNSGLQDAVLRAAQSRPLLGVCVGEQMLLEASDEVRGDAKETRGLGLINGRVVRFGAHLVDAAGNRLKVPHMGWNKVYQSQPHALWKDISEGSRFYFVHSYFAVPTSIAQVAGYSHYGNRLCVAITSNNIFATQFHPEKSAANGLKLYENFISWQP